MEDQDILDQFFARDENAITQSAARYGSYCGAIAENILGNAEDAMECVNDAMLRAWDSIPPNRPEKLRIYLGRIVRNLALDRWRADNGKYRAATVPLEELRECIPGGDTPEGRLLARELGEAIDRFLRQCSRQERQMFIRRYYHVQPMEEIAREAGITANAASVRLHRTRVKLKKWLIQEGFL